MAYARGLAKVTQLEVGSGDGTGEVTRFARDGVTGGYVVGTVSSLPYGGGFGKAEAGDAV